MHDLQSFREHREEMNKKNLDLGYLHFAAEMVEEIRSKEKGHGSQE